MIAGTKRREIITAHGDHSRHDAAESRNWHSASASAVAVQLATDVERGIEPQEAVYGLRLGCV
jgi:hypothetical protein